MNKFARIIRSPRAAVATLAVVGATGAQAAATEAVAAITAAQADALSVAGGLLAMGVAVWGAMFLYRKFFR